jgi:hypothetical protein
MKLGAFARGLATYLPGIAALQRRVTHTGGTNSAHYCYSVWFRHFLKAHEAGLCNRIPARVAEFGPGDSIGIGLAALLSGADCYYGLDALPLANLRRNLDVYDELIDLFRRRAEIPHGAELAGVRPSLRSYSVPAGLVRVPDEARINRIRRSIEEPGHPESMIRYAAPWWDAGVIEPGAVDMVFSQAVLEHVENLDAAYAAMREWVSARGWLSHQIDFRCHGTAGEWNGHWACSDLTWRLLRGRRSFLINREPLSTHHRLLRAAGFVVALEETGPGVPLDRSRLARRFMHLSDTDLATTGAFILARRDSAGP